MRGAACRRVCRISTRELKKALARAKGLFKKQPRGKAAIDAAVARLIADPKGKHIKHADVVIEAIVEKLDVKQKLFEELEAQMKPGAVLATNTSSLRLEDIAKPLKDPGRLVGLHFFNPVAQLPLVEVVHGEGTREEEVQGNRFRHRHHEAAADREELPRLPRQSRAVAIHDGGRAPLR